MSLDDDDPNRYFVLFNKLWYSWVQSTYVCQCWHKAKMNSRNAIFEISVSYIIVISTIFRITCTALWFANQYLVFTFVVVIFKYQKDHFAKLHLFKTQILWYIIPIMLIRQNTANDLKLVYPLSYIRVAMITNTLLLILESVVIFC